MVGTYGFAAILSRSSSYCVESKHIGIGLGVEGRGGGF